MQGPQEAIVRIGYVYGLVYTTPATFAASFARFGTAEVPGVNRSASQITIYQTREEMLGGWEPPGQALGGWTLDIHHVYALAGQVLYRGDGTRDDVAATAGTIMTVAGTGLNGISGDQIPAPTAPLATPQDVAVGPDGTLYIAEAGSNRIRRVGLDGIITTVAGTSTGSLSGDGGLATAVRLGSPRRVAVGPDGSLYIAEQSTNRIRRVGPDGIITTIAGTGTPGFSGDGGAGDLAQLSSPMDVALGPDDSVYIADTGNNRIRRVGPDGIITTVAGIGTVGFSGDDGPATLAQLPSPLGIAVGPDDSLYIATAHRIRRVSLTRPGLSAGEFIVPARDGGELYVFSSAGRHLRTLDALTGAVRYEFTCAAGLLTAVTDRDGNVTTVERDANGNPTAIVAPFGQRTTLALNASGYLDSITNPAGESLQLEYAQGGLLSALTEPEGHAHHFTYDDRGRLVRDEDPAGGSKTLTRTEQARGFTVTVTTAEGVTSTYQVENLTTGAQRRVNTSSAGLQTVTVIGTDGGRTVTAPDGTVTRITLGPDPRFGMLAPLIASAVVTTPGGLTLTLSESRAITLTDPNNPLSLTALTETVLINGQSYTSTWSAAAHTITSKTPEGRTSVTSLDGKGRVTGIHLPGLDDVQYTYDARGRLETVGQGSRITTLTYDAAGNLATITDPLSQRVAFAYDLVGRVREQTLPDGRVIGFTYDANSNVASVTPAGRPPHEFDYTPTNQLEDYIPPPSVAGAETTPTHYAYDLQGRLTEIDRPDEIAILLEYCGCGRLESITQPGGMTTFGYDPVTGQLRTIAGPDGGTLTYDYDGDLLTDTLSYNDLGEPETYRASAGGTTLFSVEDTRDALGRIHQRHEMIGGVTHTYVYTYDAAGRLSDVEKDGVLVSRYTYDANGNRLSHMGLSGTTNGAYDNQDRLLSYGTQTYTYTANGELRMKTETATGQTTTYSYDALGNLLAVTLPDGTQIEYVVDGQNRRIGKRVNGVLEQGFLYRDALAPVAELDGAGNVVSRFVYAGGGNVPDYMVRGGVTYRLITDQVGSVRLVVNAATGEVVQRMDYDEFGNVTLDTSPGFQPFGFAGGLYDRDTGLVRFGARDYDAATGRWTAKDPTLFLGRDTNVYGYVLNDPVNLHDPEGLEPWYIFPRVIEWAGEISDLIYELRTPGARGIAAGVKLISKVPGTTKWGAGAGGAAGCDAAERVGQQSRDRFHERLKDIEM